MYETTDRADLSRGRVCIIGAGTAGLCAARHALSNGLKPVIFEQTAEIGGTWVFSEATGSDKYGIDIHTSLYEGLRTNLPKEVMGYPDFEIEANEESYVEAKYILRFLRSYAQHHHLEECIRFLHYVVRIQERRNAWQVVVKDLANDCIRTCYFEFVLICNGHYHTPSLPKYPRAEDYQGKQIHSHDYRRARTYAGETVLIIGAGPSGMDLANEVSKTAHRVTLSHHLPEQPKTSYRHNVNQRPDVRHLTKDGAVFSDGTHDTYSVILYCTGYKYSFPFLSASCGIYVDENHVQPLYKHCVNVVRPTMAFIGLPYYVCASQMMDLQVRFVMKYFTHQKSLPSADEMLRDTESEMQRRWSKGYKKRQAHMMGPDQVHYYDDLTATADLENIKPVMTLLHNESSQLFLDRLTTFREDIFRLVDADTFVKIN